MALQPNTDQVAIFAVSDHPGMEPLFDGLQRQVLQKVAERLFPREGASLDRHHSFVVQYEEGKDLGLDMHVDNSDVTFNVCLGREFTGATPSRKSRPAPHMALPSGQGRASRAEEPFPAAPGPLQPWACRLHT